MPRYKVEVCRRYYATHTVEVEAKTEELARDKAELESDRTCDQLSMNLEEVEILDVTQI